MPKLDRNTATTVNTTEGSSDFEPLPAGVYTARLMEVNVKEGRTAPYWSWTFEILEPDFLNRRMWVNTSLSPAAAWKMKEVFDAFGADAGTDTDELCGQAVRLTVTQRVIETGNKKGEIGNNVDRVSAAAPTTTDDDDIF